MSFQYFTLHHQDKLTNHQPSNDLFDEYFIAKVHTHMPYLLLHHLLQKCTFVDNVYYIVVRM